MPNCFQFIFQPLEEAAQVISWRMKGVGNGQEFVFDSILGEALKQEEPAICGNDVAGLKAIVVLDHLRSDALGLSGGGRLFLDPAVLLGKCAENGLQGQREKQDFCSFIPLVIGLGDAHSQSWRLGAYTKETGAV